ncbi:MAG: hypothetical protein M1832_005756 [Thelocarpon impressellum]|nr:MAG: hypothetical protein M1832_005756 [Thelocarpon impressellum]
MAATSPRFRRKSSTMEDAIHDLPEKLAMAPAQLYTSPSSVLLRSRILKKCREDILQFLNIENGQVAIYDAVNPVSAGREALAKEFLKYDVKTLFIESSCDDERIIEENVRSVKISSPDYVGWQSSDAVKDYLGRVSAKIPHFETMEEPHLNYIKVGQMINAGERVMVNNCTFGYLSHRIVFYLLNLHIKSRQTYFARAGVASEEDSYKTDATLSAEGKEYAKKMGEALLRNRQEERQTLVERGGSDAPLKPLTIWTSTRRRTVETAEYLQTRGYKVRQRSQMSQLNPGVCEKMSERAIRAAFPDEVLKHEEDPYHHRYPRAEIIPASYNNEMKRIHIPGLSPRIVPDSPEDIEIPVPPSGFVSPMTGINNPQEPLEGLGLELQAPALDV